MNEKSNSNSHPALGIVLAAGKGTRMKSELPKVLVPVCGRAMVEYPLQALTEAGVAKILVVVGYRAGDVEKTLENHKNLEFVTQTEQLGTGHAVRMCADILRQELENAGPNADLPVVVVAGDAPLIQGDTLRELLAAWFERPAACLLGTIEVENSAGLGRILRDADGHFLGIVEEKDATPVQREIREVNQSYYVFRTSDLLEVLEDLRANNAQREYYLTDAPALLLARGRRVDALPILRPIEAVSVNTPEQLRQAEALLSQNSQEG